MNCDDYLMLHEYIREARTEAMDAVSDYILSHPAEYDPETLSMCREGASVGIYYNRADMDQPAYSVFLDSDKATKEVHVPSSLLRRHMPKEETIEALYSLRAAFRAKMENRANEMMLTGHALIGTWTITRYNSRYVDGTRKYNSVEFFGYFPDVQMVTFRTIANTGPIYQREEEFKIDIPSATFKYYPTAEEEELLEMVRNY